jgi:hypothetical protein
MFSRFAALGKPIRRIGMAAAAALGLVACAPVPMSRGPAVPLNAPIPVALIVPGASASAGDQALSQSLENAARLAIADLQGVQIDLRVYNTGTDPAQAAAVAVQAVDAGAKIILGPVYADAANAVGVAVAPRGVNVLSFSNNPSIAGGNVFILGQTFQTTADRLVGYAAQQGRGRILLVHDTTAAGEIARGAVEGAIARSGASLAGRESYAFSQQAVVDATPRIVSTARGSGAQSIFLTADSAGALPLFGQLLPEQGLGPDAIQWIGLTRWDAQSATLALPGLQGGWFALPDPGLSAQFQSRYAAAYGAAPHPIAGLAYDGIAAVGALAGAGRTDALTRAALTQTSGFVGVNGVFRLRPDGTTDRGLAVAEIRDNQVVVIDPAPRSFAGAGF